MTKKEEATIAAARARASTSIEPRAKSVYYDASARRLVLELQGGAMLALPIRTIDELAGASNAELADVRAGFGGRAIVLENRDVDISVAGLLRDLVGLSVSASALGKKGGSASSPAKTTAVRENGKRGGRPRKASA
jgi:hypothetical protein